METLRIAAPTKLDMLETKEMLKDFGISTDANPVTIPSFKTAGELYRWRSEKIRKFLSKYDH